MSLPGLFSCALTVCSASTHWQHVSGLYFSSIWPVRVIGLDLVQVQVKMNGQDLAPALDSLLCAVQAYVVCELQHKPSLLWAFIKAHLSVSPSTVSLLSHWPCIPPAMRAALLSTWLRAVMILAARSDAGSSLELLHCVRAAVLETAHYWGDFCLYALCLCMAKGSAAG